MNLVDDLSGALERHEIVSYFQPQVDTGSQRIVAAEALARWQHPVHGLLTPDIFIPAAQEHGLIDDIGEFMVDEAWAAAARWRDAGNPIQVSVNVSATQLSTDRLTDQLTRKLRESDLKGQAIIVEITETHEFEDAPEVATRLRHVRELGLGLSIDDFGAGFSSIERLKRVPATELKIDLSLIQDDTDDAYAVLIEIVEEAHRRGMRVVAEGVETEAQRHRVEVLRCHRAQGFLYGRPMPMVELGAMLAQSSR